MLNNKKSKAIEDFQEELKIYNNNEDILEMYKDFINKFGEIAYEDENINSISIKINFQDGSSLGYKKDREEDEIKKMIEKAKNDRL